MTEPTEPSGPATPAGRLAGYRVLVTADRPAAVVALRAAGAEPLVVPLVRTVGPADPAGLDRALAELADGRFDWLAVTSGAAVPQLTARAEAGGTDLAQVLTGVRVAAVGPGTARALEAVGVPVDLVPPGPSSARDLVRAWPPGGAERILFARGDLAAATLPAGLRAAGHDVVEVTAYRTVPAEPPDPAVRAAWATGQVHAALLTSGSAARALADRLGPPSPGTLVCCIGPSTAAEARRVGLPVAAVATEQTMSALVAALVAATAQLPHPRRGLP